MAGTPLKHSYTVPCAATFRDAVEALAARRNVNAGDLARSILLVLPMQAVADFPDPGEPAANDRETVVLKSGPAKGRPWRRKPRLQVRMPPGHDVLFIRKALGLVLAMDGGRLRVNLSAACEPAPVHGERRRGERRHEGESPELGEIKEELERLRTIVAVLAFEPLPDGVRTREDALHVLGFPPDSDPDGRTLRAKFRMLATIHHPDGRYGDHQRMSQLNQAMELLRNSAA